jgi:NADPH-dependent 7-cyano-7-deazaguanine reductase QueF-like protein
MTTIAMKPMVAAWKGRREWELSWRQKQSWIVVSIVSIYLPLYSINIMDIGVFFRATH